MPLSKNKRSNSVLAYSLLKIAVSILTFILLVALVWIILFHKGNNTLPAISERNYPENAKKLKQTLGKTKNSTLDLIVQHKIQFSSIDPQKTKPLVSENLSQIISLAKKGKLPVADKDKIKIPQTDSIAFSKNSPPKTGTEIKASPALRAVLKAMQNGTFALPQSSEDSDKWSDPFSVIYSDKDLNNIHKLTVLKTGSDIFLSLGYKALSATSAKKDTNSKKIAELKAIIDIIDKIDEEEANAAEGKSDLDRKRAIIRARTQKQQQQQKSILNFLGITRKSKENDYEDLTKSYRSYKMWMERMKKLDENNRLKQRKEARSYSTTKTRRDSNGYNRNNWKY